MSAKANRRPRRAPAIGSLVALALALGPAARGDAPGDLEEGPPRAESADREALSELFSRGEAPSADELLDRLLALGPELVPALSAHLAAPEAASADAAPLLPETRRRAWRHALDELPAAALTRRERPEGPRAAEIALAVFESLGTANDVALLFELATPRDAGEPAHGPVQRRFAAALAALIAREPSAYRALSERFDAIDARLRWGVVRAVGASGRRAGLDLFAERLGRDPALDVAILSEVGRLAAAVGPPFDFGFRLRLRSYLGAQDEALRREAALVAGRMGDLDAIPELVPLLRDASEGVRANAHWSLCALSGKRLSLDPDRWSAWWKGEAAWWRDQAPAFLRSLGGDSDAERIRALAALSSHRAFRDEIARELVALLGRGDPPLVRGLCSGLANLRSPVAVRELVELLRGADEGVRRQAWLALRAITGRDLPASYEAWAAPAAG